MCLLPWWWNTHRAGPVLCSFHAPCNAFDCRRCTPHGLFCTATLIRCQWSEMYLNCVCVGEANTTLLLRPTFDRLWFVVCQISSGWAFYFRCCGHWSYHWIVVCVVVQFLFTFFLVILCTHVLFHYKFVLASCLWNKHNPIETLKQ